MQIVLWSYRNQNINPFQLPFREYKFVGRTLKISQKGEGLGRVVWDSAVVLCDYLEKHLSNSIRNKRVLELGAGTGLVGMVAALLGATVVTTDMKAALPHLQKNIDECVPDKKDLLTAKELSWGESAIQFYKENGPFDFILASDVIYEVYSFDLLLETLCHVSTTTTPIFIAYKQRYEKEKIFFHKAKQYFEIAEVSRELMHPEYQKDTSYSIFQFTKK